MSYNTEELEEYASLEGTEFGDYAIRLLSLRECNTHHGMSEDFNKSLDKEISEILKIFKESSTIVDIVEEVKIRRKVLEWDD